MSMTYEECQTPRLVRLAPDIPPNVMDQFNMHGKVCLNTGASRGIGFTVAEGLAEAGANIMNVYSSENPTMGQKAADLAKRCRVKVVNRQCDVVNALDVKNLISEVYELFGRLDVFIANAAICIPNSILDETVDDYHAQMRVNVDGVYYCAKYVGEIFRKQGSGNFIITSSISARVVTVPLDHTSYNMTKAAVTHLGRSLAREWRDFARVNVVSPGWVATDMSSDPPSVNEALRMSVSGRLAHVNELEAIYLCLASDASSYVTGADFTVDGGYTLP